METGCYFSGKGREKLLQNMVNVMTNYIYSLNFYLVLSLQKKVASVYSNAFINQSTVGTLNFDIFRTCRRYSVKSIWIIHISTLNIVLKHFRFTFYVKPNCIIEEDHAMAYFCKIQNK